MGRWGAALIPDRVMQVHMELVQNETKRHSVAVNLAPPWSPSLLWGGGKSHFYFIRVCDVSPIYF